MSMWAMLIAAIVAAVIAFTRPRADRTSVLLTAAVVLLGMGVFGMSTGMTAVAANFSNFPDKAAAIGEGLGELANNGIFSVLLALLFGVAAFVAKRRASATA
jgi:drug/metabolite transporter (DMT)-like permease